jgi:hypothetical protein
MSKIKKHQGGKPLRTFFRKATHPQWASWIFGLVLSNPRNRLYEQFKKKREIRSFISSSRLWRKVVLILTVHLTRKCNSSVCVKCQPRYHRGFFSLLGKRAPTKTYMQQPQAQCWKFVGVLTPHHVCLGINPSVARASGIHEPAKATSFELIDDGNIRTVMQAMRVWW